MRVLVRIRNTDIIQLYIQVLQWEETYREIGHTMQSRQEVASILPYHKARVHRKC